jgi:hypothetical protein
MFAGRNFDYVYLRCIGFMFFDLSFKSSQEFLSASELHTHHKNVLHTPTCIPLPAGLSIGLGTDNRVSLLFPAISSSGMILQACRRPIGPTHVVGPWTLEYGKKK